MSRAARLATGLFAVGSILTTRPSGSQPAPAAQPTAQPAAPRAVTSPVPKAVPALADAVSGLAKTIAGYGGHVGVAILDVESGELLAADNDHRPFNPASNAKIFTAATALATLHGNFRFETGLYGQQKGGTVGSLVLRGHGDPSLTTRDLWEMVRELKESGVRRVEGDILVDQRFFDDQHVPPAFEQQPNEWAYFRAPVSAVALNENTVTLNVRPASKDAAASAWFDPPGFVDIDGSVKTCEADKPQSVTLQLAGKGQRLSARLGGRIPETAKPIHFVRRVDDPTLLAGYALKSLLLQAGIQVAGDVKPGGERVKSVLVLHRSRPLSDLLYELGKMSDNFYAEMVFKSLGAERKGGPAKSADGAEIVTKYLSDVGALEDGVVVKNGSGLFDANRVTPWSMVKVLRAAYRDPAISSEFVAQLSIGGVDGTLHGRFRREKALRIVRAKTGTLEAAATLSGYVLAPAGKAPIAFSILVNDVAGKVSGSRQAMDKVVEAIVRHLWRAA